MLIYCEAILRKLLRLHVKMLLQNVWHVGFEHNCCTVHMKIEFTGAITSSCYDHALLKNDNLRTGVFRDLSQCDISSRSRITVKHYIT
jgi:hypothetical protein